MSIERTRPNADQMDAQNMILNRIAEALGAYAVPYSWAGLQSAVRAGIIHLILDPGDQIPVDTSETLTTAVSGTGITAATVTKDTFLAAAGTEHHDYEFVFQTGGWHYNSEPVTLSDYGISVTGTAVENDAVHIHRTATAYDTDVMGLNEVCPVNSALTNSITLLFRKCFGTRAFDPSQYLYSVQAAAWPSGLPAGKYKVTLSHGAYSGDTAQDGTYVLVTTQTVPVGGGIRHSTMGAYQSDGYAKTQITNGTFTTYAANTVDTVESGLTCREYDAETDTDAVDLGTASGSDPSYKSGEYINFTERQAYGSNRWSTSYIRQWLNSRDAKLNWVPKTIWSRNATTPANAPEGFLHLLDPELVAVLAVTRTRYALSVADGYGYEDVEDTVTLATMLDVFGSQNNSISEGPVDASGTVTRTTAFTFWKTRTTNADRIKLNGSSAAYWWLGSAYPSLAYNERYVNSSGDLSYGNVVNSRGVVPRLTIA